MQTISIRTTQNVTIKYRLAGLGDRILAYIIDVIIVTFYTIILWIMILLGLGKYDIDTSIIAIFVGILAIPIVFYNLLFEIFMDCQTPGKRMIKIKIVRLDGANPTVGNHFLRWLCRLIDIGPIGVILIAVTEKGQRLGDIAADTTVIKLIDQREITSEEIFIAPDIHYSPLFPQVIQLDTRDIELIQKALEANRDFGNSHPVMVVTDKIKSLLGISSELAPTEFLYTVVKDYNHLTSR